MNTKKNRKKKMEKRPKKANQLLPRTLLIKSLTTRPKKNSLMSKSIALSRKKMLSRLGRHLMSIKKRRKKKLTRRTVMNTLRKKVSQLRISLIINSKRPRLIL